MDPSLVNERRIERILVPTSFGETQSVALAWALELAACFDARITLLHVLEADNQQVMLVTGRDPYQAQSELERLAGARLRELAVDHARIDETVVEVGSAPSEIAHFARERGVDLVVLARHGSRAPGDRSVLGAVARRMKRLRTVPVLFVDGAQPLPQERPWLRELFVASDGSLDSARGVRAAVGLARALGREHLTVGQVVQTPAWLRLLAGASGDGDDGEALARLRDQARAELEREVSAAEPPLAQVRCEVGVSRDVPGGILDLAHGAGADLIVVPTHGRGAVSGALLGSTSARLVQLSRRPLLLLPRAWLEARYGAEGGRADGH